jgi:hypothetical protein
MNGGSQVLVVVLGSSPFSSGTLSVEWIVTLPVDELFLRAGIADWEVSF